MWLSDKWQEKVFGKDFCYWSWSILHFFCGAQQRYSTACTVYGLLSCMHMHTLRLNVLALHHWYCISYSHYWLLATVVLYRNLISGCSRPTPFVLLFYSFLLVLQYCICCCNCVVLLESLNNWLCCVTARRGHPEASCLRVSTLLLTRTSLTT